MENGSCPIGKWESPYVDLALIQVVYTPYLRFLPRNLAAIERWWPDHPGINISPKIDRQKEQLLETFRGINEPYAILLFSDYRVCGPVKTLRLAECMNWMRRHPECISCSLTWEPVSKEPYDGFELLPPYNFAWPYAINGQARIWNVELLRKLLLELRDDYDELNVEQELGRVFANWENPVAVSYPIPAPHDINSMVDCNDKSEWIIPYHNIMHNGRPDHPSEARNVLIGCFTAPKFGHRLEMCQQSWMADAREAGQDYVVVCTGDPEASSGEKLFVDVPDDLAHLPMQVREWCKWALQRDDWDYLFKCDDDTCISIPRFMDFDPEPHDYIGGLCRWHGEIYANGGAGWMASRRAVAVLAERLPDTGSEDVEVGRALRESGIAFKVDKRFVGWPSEVNRRGAITIHTKNSSLFLDFHNATGLHANPGVSYPPPKRQDTISQLRKTRLAMVLR